MPCTWPEEPAISLDLGRLSARRHVLADARTAEEIAIHHADVLRGRRSGHYAGGDEYVRTREQCLTALTGQIAQLHRIDQAPVAAAVGQRDPLVDGAWLLIFVALFAIAANAFIRRLLDRFPPDDRWPALIALAAVAFPVSVAGVIAGGLGGSIVEMIRVGDRHLSYRATRLPWNQHWLLLVLVACGIFSITAAHRWRGRDRISAAQ